VDVIYVHYPAIENLPYGYSSSYVDSAPDLAMEVAGHSSDPVSFTLKCVSLYFYCAGTNLSRIYGM